MLMETTHKRDLKLNQAILQTHDLKQAVSKALKGCWSSQYQPAKWAQGSEQLYTLKSFPSVKWLRKAKPSLLPIASSRGRWCSQSTHTHTHIHAHRERDNQTKLLGEVLASWMEGLWSLPVRRVKSLLHL